jgi:Family of unknown function (DUF6152)
MRNKASAVLGAMACMMCVPSFGHHSFAMFDASQSITLRGTVKDFRWNNPHVFIQLMASGEGNVAAGEWSIELTSPQHLARAGWRPGTLKSGDQVTLVIHPLREGARGGQFVSGVTKDGAPIGESPAADRGSNGAAP